MTTPVLAHELVQQRDSIPVDDVIDGPILDVHPRQRALSARSV